MILTEFPDIGWLKRQIHQRFQERRAYNNLPLDTDGFPSVIINTTVKESYRPDITGPISLFMNLRGSSRCKVDNRMVTIPEDFFFISNRFQPYTLEIESSTPVETFNIHIGEAFSEGVLDALLTPADTILNNGTQQQARTVSFYNQLYRRDDIVNNMVEQLQRCRTGDVFDKLFFEERLEALLVYLLAQHRSILQQVKKLPPVKLSTKTELYKRLGFAADYIHSMPFEDISLHKLAEASCLSKYHFLRLFRQVYGMSPYQYIQDMRFKKAKALLRTSLPVHEIAFMLGFDNSSSFSRLFFRRKGMYPAAFRSLEN